MTNVSAASRRSRRVISLRLDADAEEDLVLVEERAGAAVAC